MNERSTSKSNCESFKAQQALLYKGKERESLGKVIESIASLI
jgi:hypothetical protein